MNQGVAAHLVVPVNRDVVASVSRNESGSRFRGHSTVLVGTSDTAGRSPWLIATPVFHGRTLDKDPQDGSRYMKRINCLMRKMQSRIFSTRSATY